MPYKDLDKRREWHREYFSRNPDYKKKYYRLNPEKMKRWRFKKKYGLSLEDYEDIKASQNGCCAICGTNTDKLVIDHCHVNGYVRGLLCSGCNTGLGYFQESVASLQDAITYLRRDKSPAVNGASEITSQREPDSASKQRTQAA